MKHLIIFLICCCSLSIHGQDIKPEFDGHKWEPPYHLPIPTSWTTERFLIPIAFAPQIPYKGVEDIRFAPGWGNAKSEEYWSYTFLWYLDGTPITRAAIIEKNLTAYYTGLISINTDTAKLKTMSEKERQVKTSFKNIETTKGDLKTFSGTVEMLDFMQLKPIRLNGIVHVRACSQENKTILFYKLSPKPYTDKIWVSFNQLWMDFSCNKK